MKASHSELTGLLKQSFEGYGLPQGIYELAAASIVWSEAHGFDGLKLFEASMGSIDPASAMVLVQSQSADEALYFEVNSSAAFWGSRVAGLGIVRSLLSGGCEISVRGGFDHKLMFKSIVDASQKGLHARLSWPHQGKRAVAEIKPNQHNIEYTEYELQTDSQIALLSLSKSRLENIEEPELSRWSAAHSARAYNESLDHGIDVPEALWAELVSIASRVLVESTEQSRHGAGD